MDSKSNRIPLSQGSTEATTAPPPYDVASVSIDRTKDQLPSGRWDFASNISPSSTRLALDRDNRLVWHDYAASSSQSGYQHDGFTVSYGSRHITIIKQSYTWTCDNETGAGRILRERPPNLALDHFGRYLVIFQWTAVVRNYNRPARKQPEDKKGSLHVEKPSHGVFYFTGPDIAQVKGDEQDIVIKSSDFLRLWNVPKSRFRWERCEPCGSLVGITDKYVIVKVGDYHLHERKKGYEYAQFTTPLFPGLSSSREEDTLGPTLSKRGHLVHKTCKKAFFVLDIGDDVVRMRMWEASEDIEGSMALRGDLDNMEVKLIGSDYTWTQHEDVIGLEKNRNLIKKYLLG